MPRKSIIIRVTSLDGLNERKSFQRLGPARKFAQRYVGEHPDYSEQFGYAIDGYGATKVEADGATMAELFPEQRASAPTRCECDDLDGEFDTRFDPVTGTYVVICAYCVSPAGIAGRQRRLRRGSRKRQKKTVQQYRRQIKRYATGEIPF